MGLCKGGTGTEPNLTETTCGTSTQSHPRGHTVRMKSDMGACRERQSSATKNSYTSLRVCSKHCLVLQFTKGGKLHKEGQMIPLTWARQRHRAGGTRGESWGILARPDCRMRPLLKLLAAIALPFGSKTKHSLLLLGPIQEHRGACACDGRGERASTLLQDCLGTLAPGLLYPRWETNPWSAHRSSPMTNRLAPGNYEVDIRN